MPRQHWLLLVLSALLHCASSLKLISLVGPYLAQSPSTAESGKDQNDDELPLYRDLPPIMKAAKDLTEALEATRKLMIVHPPFDDGDFLARLKEAAVEYRATVIGEPPHLFDLKIKKLKSPHMDHTEKGNETVPTKDPKLNVNEEDSFKKDQTAQPSTEEKGKENPSVSESKLNSQMFQADSKATFTSVKKPESSNFGHTEKDNETIITPSIMDESEEDPFKEVEVKKLAVGEGEVTTISILDTESPLLPPAPPEAGVKVGVKVEAPFTHVQVKRGDSNGYFGHGAEIGVRVEAPFTNVKVKKLADIPAGALPDPNGGGGGSYPDVGIRVEAPFVRVKVDGPAIHHVSGVVDEAMKPLGKNRDDHPRRSGRPLNLDINIPGIFNLKLLRDETGRGRLGIGVLPVFTSLVNPHKASDPYPGPPPSY